MNDDSSLREQFASLRHADAASAPDFAQVTGRARRGSNDALWKLGLATCLVVPVAAVSMWLLHVAPPRGSIHAAAPMLADWHAPTDFLLDTPGRELLHTVPDLRLDSATALGPLPPTLMTTPAPGADREHS